jgi:hypothetical protein
VTAYVAVTWAQEAARRFGRRDQLPEISDRPVVVLPLPQAELARRTATSASNVAHYLTQLGDVVLRRRGGIVLDLPGLVSMAVEAERARVDLPQRTTQVAWALARHLGHATNDGTVLRSARHPGRPPTLKEMAVAAGLTPGTLSSHLRRLEAAGRLVKRGRFWLMPPSLQNFAAGTGRAPDVAHDVDAALHDLWQVTGELSELQARTELLKARADEANVSAFCDRVDRLYELAAGLLAECGVEPVSGRLDHDPLGGPA